MQATMWDRLKKDISLSILVCIVVCISNNHLYSQSKIDSIKSKLLQVEESEERLKLLHTLIEEQLIQMDDEIKQTGKKGIELAKKYDDVKVGADIHVNLSDYYKTLGAYDTAYVHIKIAEKLLGEKAPQSIKALFYNKTALIFSRKGVYDSVFHYTEKTIPLANSIGDTSILIVSYNMLGIAYTAIGNYTKALEYYQKTLAMVDSEKKKAGLLANIGNLHYHLEDWQKAIDYNSEAIELYSSLNNETGVASCLLSIGHCYLETKKYSIANENYNQALSLFKKNKQMYGVAVTELNIGELYSNQKQYTEALHYTLKAKKKMEEFGKPGGYSTIIYNLGVIYRGMGDYHNAERYFLQSISMVEKEGNLDLLSSSYKQLANLYFLNKKYAEAYKTHIKYVEVKDSLINEKSQKQIAEMEAKYQSEKKQLEIDKLENEKTAKDAQIIAQQEQAKRQKMQIIAFASGFGLMLILAFVIFRNYRRKQKDNLLIAAQKQQVERQKELVEEKNKEITDSITYAKRIQDAILPPHSLVKEYLHNSFIFYKPKDIVAGDFYWMEPMEDTLLFAAADCTGHGVPGAMVSVVCNNALNRSAREFMLNDPGKILDKTRELVIETFEESQQNVNDGMDIAICSLNTKTNELQFSGANNPLWIFKKGIERVEDVLEIKADKQPIGKYANPKPFKTHTVQLDQGDTFYIFSDGFADQFGGPKGKKFKYKPFKELLLSLQNEPTEIQKQELEKAFDQWKDDLEQVDDVCIIGIKI